MHLAHRVGDQPDVGRGEPRVIPVGPYLVDRQGDSLVAERAEGARQVLPILPARGVARVGAGGDDHDIAYAAAMRFPEGVSDERLGVAVSPQQWSAQIPPAQLGAHVL